MWSVNIFQKIKFNMGQLFFFKHPVYANPEKTVVDPARVKELK